MTEFHPADIYIEAEKEDNTIPVIAVYSENYSSELERLSDAQKSWLKVSGFKGNAGEVELLPGVDGSLELVVAGLGSKDDEMLYHHLGALSGKLPKGDYHLEGEYSLSFDGALAFGLGAYSFTEYKKKANGKKDKKSSAVRLKLEESIDTDALYNLVSSQYFGRNLINTPANVLGPDEYERRIAVFAKEHGAKMSVTKGSALIKDNFPLIHAVGRASDQEPRLVELLWGNSSDPKITLVGKGICFDTGGLNLKPGSSMNLMKKDMGGSATALTIASMVMGAKLPVSLRVLLPIAENNISANAFRPGDVIDSRLGLTVEIDNTDAEGRLVLADALAYGDEDETDHLFCFATLTGAARVGTGPDLPPFYTDDEELASGLEASSKDVLDYMWRLPFWKPYDKWLSSKIADVNHCSSSPFAGSMTAALFLKRFVKNAKSFVHFDIYGWTPFAQPGKPFGGEPQAARAVFDYLQKKYK